MVGVLKTLINAGVYLFRMSQTFNTTWWIVFNIRIRTVVFK